MSTDLPPLVAALSRPEVYGAGVEHVERVATHISWVFLTGKYAYKIKKPVKLPFLDFSTLERRRHFCETELELNRRLAPELYLEVVPIGGTPEAPVLGAEPAIEYAVKMREFPADARLDRLLAADGVDRDLVLAFAEHLARFHDELPPATEPANAPERALAAALENFTELEALAADDARLLERLRSLHAWTERTGRALSGVLAQRFADGRHREGHGDLHLENLIALNGEVVAFDALEFDPDLRRVDVVSEAAFPAMDLLAHGRADLGFWFMNRYFEIGGDYGGLEVLRFYLVYRALVRSKVRAIKAAQSDDAPAGTPYLDLALELAAKRRPLLVLTHGLSGSGKTHVSTELVGRLPALRARSDLERKRLGGFGERDASGSPVGGGLYDAATTADTYGRLADAAAIALRHGFDFIADATFLRAAERERFRALAGRLGSRFAMLDCTATEAVLRERVAARHARGSDASEADLRVLEHQLATAEAFTAAERGAVLSIDTAAPIDYEALAATLRDRR